MVLCPGEGGGRKLRLTTFVTDRLLTGAHFFVHHSFILEHLPTFSPKLLCSKVRKWNYEL